MTPDIAKEIARILTAEGWSVRKLREAGIGSRPAESLLGKNDSLPSLESAEKALRLTGRMLWHKRISGP